MFKRMSAPDYQAELPWKYPDRPVLKAWHRWAIPYNLRHIQIVYAILATFALAFGVFIYSAFLGKDKPVFQWNALFIGILSTVFFLLLLGAVLFEKRIFVYRCTKENIEVISWKEGYRKVAFIMKSTAIIGAIALIIAATHTNQPNIFLLAFIGPGGIALIYVLSMGKNLQQFADETHKELAWNNVHTVLIDTNRKIITLLRTHHAKDLKGSRTGVSTTYAFFVAYPIKSFAEVLLFIKQQVPSAEYRDGKAKMNEMYERIDNRSL